MKVTMQSSNPLKRRPMPVSTTTVWICLFLLTVVLTGCSPIEEDTGSTSASLTGAATLALSSDTFTILSNNEDFATLTATVLDASNGALSDVTVLFSSDSGRLSASTATTDAGGTAQVDLFSGNIDRSNRNITVTATVAGVAPRSTVIQVTGTEITYELDKTSLQADGSDSATLSLTVKDAGGFGVSGAAVAISLAGTSTGSVNISPSQGTTDTSGKLSATITGASAGDVTLTITALGATRETSDKVITVTAAGGQGFGITSPTDDPHALATDIPLTITVAASGQNYVLFSTTLGTFTESGDATYRAPVTSGTATAHLISANAGIATVQASAYDADMSPSDTLTVGISAPASTAAKISLQGSASVVAQSIGDVKNTITLSATVSNSDDEPVGSAIVAFSINNPTGGGEYITPAVVMTNTLGVAEATFTSGGIASDPTGVEIVAKVVGQDCSGYDPPVTEPCPYEDTFAIVIGGTAGSIFFGRSTTVESVYDDSAYKLPIVVVVADGNGNAVTGAQVSLGIWPERYFTGYWEKQGDEWVVVYKGGGQNEDINRNVRLDTDEDKPNLATVACYDLDGDNGYHEPFILTSLLNIPSGIPSGNGDGQLTPPNSAAGTIPTTVTTDGYGAANFDLIYPKDSAVWIVVELTATTRVLGTETKSTVLFQLGHAEIDEEHLPASPFNAYFPWDATVCP